MKMDEFIKATKVAYLNQCRSELLPVPLFDMLEFVDGMASDHITCDVKNAFIFDPFELITSQMAIDVFFPSIEVLSTASAFCVDEMYLLFQSLPGDPLRSFLMSTIPANDSAAVRSRIAIVNKDQVLEEIRNECQTCRVAEVDGGNLTADILREIANAKFVI
jgi:hypothetical protein